VRQAGARHTPAGAPADAHPRRVRRQPNGQPGAQPGRHSGRGLDLPLVAVCVSSDEREGRTISARPKTTRAAPPARQGGARVGLARRRILLVAQRESCDLIIMGAFGHSRMRELFVGSTTDGSSAPPSSRCCSTVKARLPWPSRTRFGGSSKGPRHRRRDHRAGGPRTVRARRDPGLAHPPDLVVLPRTAAEVAEVLRLATEHRFPVIPRGTGTGLVGGPSRSAAGSSSPWSG